jgi:hypothetical protein
MKLANIVKKETPPAVQAVAEPKLSLARAALQVFRDGELAEAQRVAHAVAQALEAARATMAERDRALVNVKQDIARTTDREKFGKLVIDERFAEQQIAHAQAAVTAGELKQRAIAQQFTGLDQRLRDLVVDILMEHARQIEAELHQIEAQACERFAGLDALYAHFLAEKVVGKPVEELSAIFDRLHNFAIVNDDSRATAQTELRELLGNL